MRDKEKTKEQLITELVELRQRIADLEKTEKQYKTTELILNASEQKLRNIIEHSNELFYIHDTHHKLTYISPQSVQILGYTPDEMMTEWTNLVTENPINEMGIEITNKALKTGEKQKPYFLELYRKDGRKILLEIDESPLRDKDGNVIGIVGAARDITERKLAEEALRESEERSKAKYKGIPIPTYTWQKVDDDFVLIDYNLAGEDMTQEKVSDWLGAKLSEMYKDMPHVIDQMWRCLNDKTIIKTEMLYKFRSFNKERFFSVHYSYVPPDFVLVHTEDITDRKLAEETLKESETKFRILTETNAAAIFIYQENNFRYVNSATEAITGYTKEELLAMNFWDVVHPEFKELVKERGIARQRGEKVPLRYEFKIITKSGEERWLDATAGPIEFEGKPAAIGATFDITERKRAEKALLESEDRYRNIFEDSREAIYVSSREGKFIDVNQSALDLFGYTREEIMGLNVLQIYANPADRHRFQQEIEQKESVKNYKVRFRKKDGTEIDCLLTSTVWKSIDGTTLGYQGIIWDVTEIKKVEDQLRYLSLHDPLTGLYNRAYFEEEMHRVESGRYDSAGIIMCDVDGLKLVNDALGHHTGDNLLIAAANVLKDSFREGDVVARVGGDEFAVLLPNSDRTALEIAGNRIQDAAARYNSTNPALPLSISLGFAVSTGTPVIMSNLFKEADNNMYREKLQHSLIARSTIVQTLMKALETRDFITKGHVDRLRKLVVALAPATGLPEHKLTDLRLLAEFHDIGKVGIPEHILFKPSPLTPEEIIEMQKHCEIGHRIAIYTPDLVPIADLILKHHEWWNGKGYPLGIKGEEIPLECRILSICETYEIITSDRPYHKAMSHEEAVAELTRHSGTKFDPDLVSKFIQVLESIKRD